MERFEASPPELEHAASTLGAVEGSLGCPSRAGGELGSAELQSAVAGAFEAADAVALAMADVLAGASRTAAANAASYTATEAASASAFDHARQAMPAGAGGP